MKHAVGQIAWALRVLWVAAALLIILDVALRPYVFVDKPDSLSALRAQAAAPAPAPVVLLGSSRFRRVDPADVAAAAPGVRLVNLAFNGGTLVADAALARRYLTPAVLRAGGTRLVVVGTGVLDLNDGYRNAILVPETWGYGDFFAHILERGTDSETRLFLFEQPPVRWSSLLQGYRTNKLRGQIRGFALRLTGRMQRARPPADDDEAGGDVLENTQAQEAKGAVSLAEIPQPMTSPYLRDFHVGGRQIAALRDLAGYLREQGVALALVDGPVSDWYAGVYRHGEWAAYREALIAEARALDLPVFFAPKSAYGLVDADYFQPDGRFDGHHIVRREGRAAFARGLATRVFAPLLAEIERGARPGFAASRIEPAP